MQQARKFASKRQDCRPSLYPGLTLLLIACLLAGERQGRSGELRDREAWTRAVQAAFAEVHDGWSSDEVLVRDDLNRAFIASSRSRLPDAGEAKLNWTLLNLRKAGQLEANVTKRAPQRHEDHAHAAEIAARLTYDKYRQSIDRVLCDPTLRLEFDRIALGVTPDASAYQLRKAALSLRKARQLRPELVARVADWSKQVITLSAEEIVAAPQRVPAGPGIYVFRDSRGYLYIGESEDLRGRVTKHLDHSDRQSLARYLWQEGVAGVTVELHAFDPDSNARYKEMRRAYESELIASRRPRFNIAP
jgi:predicted GIY-YIG superfamily endonuclease